MDGQLRDAGNGSESSEQKQAKRQCPPSLLMVPYQDPPDTFDWGYTAPDTEQVGPDQP